MDLSPVQLLLDILRRKLSFSVFQIIHKNKNLKCPRLIYKNSDLTFKPYKIECCSFISFHFEECS